MKFKDLEIGKIYINDMYDLEYRLTDTSFERRRNSSCAWTASACSVTDVLNMEFRECRAWDNKLIQLLKCVNKEYKYITCTYSGCIYVCKNKESGFSADDNMKLINNCAFDIEDTIAPDNSFHLISDIIHSKQNQKGD